MADVFELSDLELSIFDSSEEGDVTIYQDGDDMTYKLIEVSHYREIISI